MNWITKIIKAGEKIKTAIHKRATKEDIENSINQLVVGPAGYILN